MKTTALTLAFRLGAAAAVVDAQQVPAAEFLAGVRDASAGEELDGGYLAVAGDEDSVIHIYRPALGTWPVHRVDLAGFLAVNRQAKETDIEGCARVGDRIYWITSHGRDSKGQVSPSRHRFFATTATASNQFKDFRPLGRPYTELVSHLIRDPRLARFGLDAATLLAPKQPGGMNIEGLAATPEGCVLIGFRNPIPGGHALLVPLLNPAEVIDGVPARLGDPALLDLGGLGIRSITSRAGQYWIIAGSYAGNGPSHLYVWDGTRARPELVRHVQLAGLNPEAITFHDWLGEQRLFVASDDGKVKLRNMPFKKLRQPGLRRFRTLWLDPEELQRQ